MKVTLIISLITSFMVTTTSNPMLFVLLILVQSLILCVSLSFFIKTSWFSYILFLIFLGGLMIIFSYVCSLASNEEMDIKLKVQILLSLFQNHYYYPEMINLLMNEGQMSYFKMMSKFTLLPTLVSMLYLLLTLIVIAKISLQSMGSLRSIKK